MDENENVNENDNSKFISPLTENLINTFVNEVKKKKNKEKIMKNMSERAAQSLAEEIDLLGPVRLKQVEEAQNNVVKAIRRLEEAGQIVISRGGADEFVS